ncbi:hypothetical protein WME90_21405 [Sorangium sp. So ce375]
MHSTASSGREPLVGGELLDLVARTATAAETGLVITHAACVGLDELP